MAIWGLAYVCDLNRMFVASVIQLWMQHAANVDLGFCVC